MQIHWLDPVNTDPQFVNLLSHCMYLRGHEVHVRANARLQFRPPAFIRWYPFSPFRTLPQRIAGSPLRYLLGASYPCDWLRAILWLKHQRVRAVLLSGHLRLPQVDTAAHRLLRRLGISTAVICHKPHPDYFEDHSPRRARRYVEYYRCASRILVMNEYTRDLMSAYYGLKRERFAIFPHPHLGAFLANVRPDEGLQQRLQAWAAGHPVLTIASGFSPERGYDLFFRALAYLNTGLPQLRVLLLVSHSVEEVRKRIRAELSAAGITREHYWLRARTYSYAELKAFMGITNVIVTPYRWTTQSGVIAMALGLGVPVVATNVGGLSNMIFHGVCGELVPPEDAAALARACRNALATGVNRRYRAGTDRARRELLSPERSADAVAATLAELASATG